MKSTRVCSPRSCDRLPCRLSPAPRSLEGRPAIVTGSTSGIGLGIARALAAQGAIVARDSVPLDLATARLLCEKQPSLAFATPEETGAFAVFLCSEAAAQVRGAALPIDGGLLSQ